MPVYPGDPPVSLTPHASLEADGYRVMDIRLGTHAGTHLDAPAHFLTAGRTVEQLPLEALVGPARVADLSAPPPEVRPGDRWLLRSGWSARWGERDYFEAFPGLSEEWVRRLAAAPAALLGLETPSLHPHHETDARCHRILLEAGVVLLENLLGLERLPDRVLLAALPLPLAGADGAPCRVVAVTPGEESEWLP